MPALSRSSVCQACPRLQRRRYRQSTRLHRYHQNLQMQTGSIDHRGPAPHPLGQPLCLPAQPRLAHPSALSSDSRTGKLPQVVGQEELLALVALTVAITVAVVVEANR